MAKRRQKQRPASPPESPAPEPDSAPTATATATLTATATAIPTAILAEPPDLVARRVPGWLLGLALVVVAFALQLPSMSGGFLWDDESLVVHNLDLRTLGGLERIWRGQGALDFFPITYTSFWVEHHLFGSNPLGYRVVSAALHAFNALLLWRVLLRLGAPGAWLAALLFAAHPLCVPSAAWISERKNGLSMSFALLATRSWLGSSDRDRVRTAWQSVSSLFFFTISLLAKPAAVAMPVAWLALSAYRRRLTGREALWVAPHLATAFLLGSITLSAQSEAPVDPGPIAQRVARAGHALGFYLSKAALPLDLSMIYPKWTIDPTQAEAWWPLCVVSIGVGLVLVWSWRHRSVAAPAALAWFIALVAPVLGFAPMAYMRHAYVSDHLVYLALPGPIALWAGFLASKRQRPGWIRRLSIAVAAAQAIALGTSTLARGPDFRSAERLFRSSLERAPSSLSAHLGLAMTLSDQNRVEEALVESEIAVGLSPTDASAQAFRGSLLLALGREAEALESLNEALRLNPQQFKVHNNLASLKLKRKDVLGAVEHLKKSVELEPTYSLGHANLARILMALGRTDEAREHYRRAVEISPDLASLFPNPP